MSLQPSKRTTGLQLTRAQWVLTIAAGLGSFLLAFVLQGGAPPGEEGLVAAVSRDRRPAVARVSLDTSPAMGRTETSGSGESLQASGSRMNRVVVRDPFGLLAPEPVAMPVPSTPPTAAPPSRTVAKVVAPAPSGPPPPPPAPVAPPLPFTAVGFIQGKRIGDGQQQTFIQQGDKLTVIRQGDTINSTYRVDDINTERVIVTYLPLGQKQSLPLLDSSK
ncbi:hypothetical protein [Polaromonas sp.]|uniref:hypothetical protein n=1 Tax=Polaromonas sp. TaxID=1869339 RepID=UPI00326688F0